MNELPHQDWWLTSTVMENGNAFLLVKCACGEPLYDELERVDEDGNGRRPLAREELNELMLLHIHAATVDEPALASIEAVPVVDWGTVQHDVLDLLGIYSDLWLHSLDPGYVPSQIHDLLAAAHRIEDVLGIVWVDDKPKIKPNAAPRHLRYRVC